MSEQIYNPRPIPDPIPAGKTIWDYKLGRYDVPYLQVYYGGEWITLPMGKEGGNQITTTVVNAGRNAEATVIGTQIGRTQSKIENYVIPFLYAHEWSKILKIFRDQINRKVRYYDQETGEIIERDMYVNDRKATAFAYKQDGSGQVEIWADCSLNLIDMRSAIKEVLLVINVSTEYFESINAPMRLPMYFAIGVGMANTDMANNSIYSDNGHARYSSVSGLKNLFASNKVYTTAEANMYLLDGSHEITPEVDNFQGYVSNEVSKSDCTFDNNPAITIQSDNSYDLIGFTIQFDTENNDYATEFSISYYDTQNSLIRRQSVYGNSETKYIDDVGTSGVNKIVVTFSKTHNYNRRIRVTGITLGIYEEFFSGGLGKENTIKTLSHNINISPLMKEIPANDFSFTIDDTLANYNPENPKGIWRYTKKGQIATLKYIQTLNDGGEESVVGGRFYLETKPEAENMDAKFKAVSRIESLEQTYDEGQYYINGRSYKSLFDDVFTFCGLGQDEYQVDSELSTKKTMIPLPIRPAKECLQLLCQACGKIAYEDTSGKIWIRDNNTVIDTYALNVAQDYTFPKYTEETPEVKNIVIKKRSLATKDSTEELAKSSFTITGTQDITIDYDLSTNHTYTISGGTVVSGAFYGRRCKLEVSVSGTQEVEIIVSGNRIEETSTNIIYSVNTDGFDCELDFSMLSENDVADELFAMYRKYLLENKRYEISYRGNPELRPQDIMQIQTRFSDEINAMILKSSFNWNNGASGSLTLKNYSN